MKIRGKYPRGLIPASPFAHSPNLTGGMRKELQLPRGRAHSCNWITIDGAEAGTKSGYWIKNFIVRTKNASEGSSKILTPIFCWSATLVLGIFSFFHFFPLARRLSLKGRQKGVISPERTSKAVPAPQYGFWGMCEGVTHKGSRLPSPSY